VARQTQTPFGSYNLEDNVVQELAIVKGILQKINWMDSDIEETEKPVD